MTNIVLDPVLIMTPDDDATGNDVHIWFHNLELWLNEALTAPFIWLHHLRASELLEEYGRFPTFSELRRLKQKYSLDINIQQIARRVNEFFRDEALDLTDKLDHLDFIVEPIQDSIDVQPARFIDRLPSYLHKDFLTLLVNCCVCRHMALPFGEKLTIATQSLPDKAKTVIVSTVIKDALPEGICNAGETITQSFSLIITPDDLPPLDDYIDIWSQGEACIIYAINQQLHKELATCNTHPFSFSLGPRFIASVKERGLDTNDLVLKNIVRAAVYVVLDLAKNISGCKLHDLRMTDAPNSPRRVRASDNAQAWRLMLRKNGAGWRLHYWQIPTPQGPRIEFSNICKESESDIY